MAGSRHARGTFSAHFPRRRHRGDRGEGRTAPAFGDHLSVTLSKDAGTPFPIGASLGDGGINVAVLSRHGERVLFCVFDDAGDRELHRFALPQRLGDVHFGFIAGLGPGTRYGLRVEGPWNEKDGHRFDPAKLLVDPYARRIDRAFRYDAALCARGVETAPLVLKAIVEQHLEEATRLPLHRPNLIYE
ncbi:MAG: hypothetical protein FJX63_06510, partial [Alphaproteobacteria bacterium]|nr:hypothetical protein [Alphaproteobacteria bacterium]